MVSSDSRVKFVEYTGAWPNLCSGQLTLMIDGKEWKFGHDCNRMHYDDEKKNWVFDLEDPEHPNHDRFWHTGGCTGFTEDYSESIVETGKWYIAKEELPEELRPLAEEIDERFNRCVPWGCCGGCL